LNDQVTELQKVLVGIGYIRELTDKSSDHVLSFGEKLSAIVINGALRDLGLRTEAFLGGRCRIVTDDHFDEAKPLVSITGQSQL